MARLPTPGSDSGTWGTVLNEYLSQSHTSEGLLKPGVVSESMLSSPLQTKINASPSIPNASLTPAKLTADSPVDGEVLSYNAGNFEWITPAASSGSGEVNTASNTGTGGAGLYRQKTGVNLEFKRVRAASSKLVVTDNTGNGTVDLDVATANLGLTKADVALGNVDNTSDSAKPISAATQTALNAKANTTHSHAATDTTSGVFVLDRMPAGYRHTVYESGGTYVRGTARTDICAVFVGQSDPGSIALEGDTWDQVMV